MAKASKVPLLDEYKVSHKPIAYLRYSSSVYDSYCTLTHTLKTDFAFFIIAMTFYSEKYL